MGCDPGWLDQDGSCNDINRSVVDNLVPIKIEETLTKFSKKNSIILDILFNTWQS
jgi:competence transcription factor ComK